jgi:Ca-activated chloride channel family protein
MVGWGVLLIVGGLIALFELADLDRLGHAAKLGFHSPWALLLLAGCLLLAWVGFHLSATRSATFRFSRVGDLSRSRPGMGAWLTPLPKALRVIAVGLIVFALARPQAMSKKTIHVDGIDIMLVLDMSKSMEEGDLVRNRLDAAQRTIRKFLVGRKDDRIGLVVFAKQAMLQCPLTLDHVALNDIVSDLALGDIDPMGTAIGDGLGLALATLRRSDAKSKVVILLTDGDSNVMNQMNPDEAKDLAHQMGVKVFTVLVGQEDGGQREPNLFGQQTYAVNPELLKRIAKDTGGKYYHAEDSAALDRGFNEVRKTLAKTERKEEGRVYAELFPRFVTPALGLLLLELLLAFTRFRRFP